MVWDEVEYVLGVYSVCGDWCMWVCVLYTCDTCVVCVYGVCVCVSLC